MENSGKFYCQTSHYYTNVKTKSNYRSIEPGRHVISRASADMMETFHSDFYYGTENLEMVAQKDSSEVGRNLINSEIKH